MIRIYFDKQIFSYLFRGEGIYYDARSALFEKKNLFLFCFSTAHIEDIINDTTEIKWQELSFMEKLVDDNYLAYNPESKIIQCYLATPKEVCLNHNSTQIPSTFRKLFDLDLGDLDDNSRNQFLEYKNVLSQLKFPVPQIELPKDKYLKNIIEGMFPQERTEISIEELYSVFTGLQTKFLEDKKFYKNLRNSIESQISEKDKSSKENRDALFNHLRENLAQTNLLDPDNIREVITSEGIIDYMSYGKLYLELDMFGINKDSSKSVKFSNLCRDGNHSYFGTCCNYVISNDKGFLEKSKKIYTELKLQTKLLEFNKFYEQLNLIASTCLLTKDEIYKQLIVDIGVCIIEKTLNAKECEGKAVSMISEKMYFGYFNKVSIPTSSSGHHFFLIHANMTASTLLFYREIKSVVDKAYRVFGTDNMGNSEFSEKDTLELHGNNWSGRHWKNNETVINLAFSNGLYMEFNFIEQNQGCLQKVSTRG